MAPQRLGQHFLSSPGWRDRIARLVLRDPAVTEADAPPPEAAARRGDLWIEIGAGHGEMTSLLAPRVGRLIAIELDSRLLPALSKQTAGLPNVSVMAGDILALDLAALTGGKPFRAYGNLPYYITSPIVHRLLSHADRLQAAFLVVQFEVAARMAARAGSRDYGYFSAFTQFYSRPQILLRIPRGAFQPPPKVSSALIALRLPGERAHLRINDEARFLEFLKACFAQKRKMLRNNLRSVMTHERATAILRECGIAPGARAEELELRQFARLFAVLSEVSESPACSAFNRE